MVKISVVMPTYNSAADILREAVDSILAQTFRDFEYIIIDDGSTNESVDYLLSLGDERIKLIRNPKNLGITKSLNIGFRVAQGKYIARMDSDDIALPARLEKQFAFMESHPDVIVCGTNVECFGTVSGVSGGTIEDMESYRIRAVFRNPGPYHPTAFFNRESLLRYHLTYDENLMFSQDYGLWVEISKYGKVYILNDVLLRYRTHSSQISQAHRKKQIQCDQMTQAKLLRELLGDVTQEELDLHYRYSTGYYHDEIKNEKALTWFRRLIEANNQVGKYDKKQFNHEVNSIIARIILHEPQTLLIWKITKLFRFLPFWVAFCEIMERCQRIIRKVSSNESW